MLEVLLVFGLIVILVISESLFEASLVAVQVQKGLFVEFVVFLMLVWFFKYLCSGASLLVL